MVGTLFIQYTGGNSLGNCCFISQYLFLYDKMIDLFDKIMNIYSRWRILHFLAILVWWSTWNASCLVFVWVCAFSSYMLIQLLLFLELVATISTLVAVPSTGWHLLVFCLFMAHLLICWLLDDSDLNDDNRMDLGFYHEIFVFCFGAVQVVTKRIVF